MIDIIAGRSVDPRDQVELQDTLAAAYAETGEFARAAEILEAAISRARSAGIRDLDKFVERLNLYKVGKPYREFGERAL